MSHKPSIGIIIPTDFVKQMPFGGASGFIQNVLIDLPVNVKIFGVGINGTPLWLPVKMRENTEFVAVYGLNLPSPIPLRLKALIGFTVVRNRILTSGVDLLYIHSPECALPFLYGNARLPLVFHQHGSGNPVTISKFRWARRKFTMLSWFFDQMHRLIYLRSDWIISIDRLCQAQAAAGGAGNKTSLIMNAVDTQCFCPDEKARSVLRDRHKIPEDCCILLFVGRIEEVKNVASLINAVKRLSDKGGSYRLYLAGDGTLRHRLEEMVKELQLESAVHFLGKVAHEELSGYYNMADLFVLPSFIEGVPMVIIEALACGTPIVATKVGGVPDIVDHGSNGILIDEGTSESIGAAVRAAQALDRDRNKISRTVAHLSSKHISNQLNDIFTRLLQNYEPRETCDPRC